MTISSNPRRLGFPGPGMEYLDENGVVRPVTGTLGVGNVPIGQDDGSVAWGGSVVLGRWEPLMYEGELVTYDGDVVMYFVED